MKTALWWVRRDLRLRDNQALAAAMQHAEQVIPCFILDDAILNASSFSARRFAFMVAGLRQLDATLRERGSYLVIRRGEPATALATLVEDTGAAHIYAERDFSPYAERRDQAIADKLPLTRTAGLTVRQPGTVEKKSGGHYTVFTPYKKSWLNLALPQRDQLLTAPSTINTPPNVQTAELPDVEYESARFESGERAARQRLTAFVEDGIGRYAVERDRMDLDGTSALSPFLRFGMVSARETAVAALEAMAQAQNKRAHEGAETWLSELIWREFYHQILHHHPHVRQGSFRPKYDEIEWRNDSAEFEAWKMGQTGFPIVDAAMRQLKEIGWMHNRARMIVASFLTKDLLINWQWGERWFMQQLLDGDHAANNGGWQWAAGTGTDAAPYFRIFNPISQSKKFDPSGNYIRRWVAELVDVPTKFVHEPWKASKSEQRQYNCVIGKNYPERIVDHKAARERTLAAYKAVG